MTQSAPYLLLMRHAKSSWAEAGLSDHQRPLNARGEKAATDVGAELYARGYAPDIIWSSDSKRTRLTAMRLIRAIPGAQEVHYNPGFYHAGPEEVLQICNGTDFPEKNLMLLGHNPGWAELHYYLSGQEHNFPTAACAVYSARKPIAANWLTPENWRLVDLILPRELE
jgi:phosphohistidine phosphatase